MLQTVFVAAHIYHQENTTLQILLSQISIKYNFSVNYFQSRTKKLFLKMVNNNINFKQLSFTLWKKKESNICSVSNSIKTPTFITSKILQLKNTFQLLQQKNSSNSFPKINEKWLKAHFRSSGIYTKHGVPLIIARWKQLAPGYRTHDILWAEFARMTSELRHRRVIHKSKCC